MVGAGLAGGANQRRRHQSAAQCQLRGSAERPVHGLAKGAPRLADRAGGRPVRFTGAGGGSADDTSWLGASQTLTLNRTNTAPIIVRGWSRSEEVSGGSDNDYSLYVDIVYQDGTPLWGQTGNFRDGTHDWEQREFVIAPEKPIRSLTLHCIFRGHSGRAWFDDVEVSEAYAPAGSVLFQGTPMTIVPLDQPAAGHAGPLHHG
jgi:hypothetical protein